MKRPAFWVLFAILSIVSALVAYRYFPQAFSIVALDIAMDREAALAGAREIMARDGLGPSGYRQAASFELDDEVQTFVELEGGGKDAFTGMLRDELYAAYTWRVRHFREGETNETLIRFTPGGRPYGFVERLHEESPGAALDTDAARAIAETGARSSWHVDFSIVSLVEHGQERRPGGRVDHTLTYERPSPTLGEGRYRLRLVVSGDRLTEVTRFVQIPEAFTRRYESMRSANDAIGVGAAVGMVVLYVVGGIGVGLFIMLRKHWVLWRHAAAWGVFISLLQALEIVNSWPLLWMTYDTAVPRGTFLAQQITTIVAVFIGFSAFFALSFMAAETLTRRAFGHHPQFWRLWSRGPGSSTAVAGGTMAGYLLVPIFLAYEVGLYFLATRTFGWWTPSDALVQPDALAAYVPWLSAIANSLQAGFWEECLFRAVPIAGAALIGDRLGHRRLFIVAAFVVQAVIFGAGHAPYPTQPSYARPVELLIPSVGFGLLYLGFGLLPAIVLHFAFDVFWFALPLFLASASGISFQRAMIVVVTLVPLWIVLWRRAQSGRWTAISPAERNAAWTPPPSRPPAQEPEPYRQHTLSRRARAAWLGLGAASLIAFGALTLRAERPGALTLSRIEAARIARTALAGRGVALDAGWQVLPVPDAGGGPAQEFVSRTAGESRRRELLGRYLPRPFWRVRVARFQGDVAERAEEWLVLVENTGDVRVVVHTLPEGRPGASLEQDAARRLAHAAVTERAGLHAARGDVKEVSARPSKLDARTDWAFTFTDTTIPPLPQGEPRIQVNIAGDEVASTAMFIYVPEEWRRTQRAADTRNGILQTVITILVAGLLVAAAVAGIVSWSRGRYAPRLFAAATALMVVVAALSFANGWPRLLAQLSTAQPLPLQLAVLAAAGLIGVTLSGAFVGLAAGALPHRLVGTGTLPERDALRLGVAIGLVGSALSAGAALLRAPAWARLPQVGAAGTIVPFAQVAIDPITAFLTATVVLATALAAVDRLSSGWSQRRVVVILVLGAIGFAGAGAPAGSPLTPWIASGIIMGAALVVAYATALRADLTMVPIVLGTMAVAGVIGRGLLRPFPGALPGALAGAILLSLVAWWVFRTLRRARAAAG